MPGDDVFSPFVDGPGDGSDDRLVTSWPGVDKPVVPPADRVAAVGRGFRGDPGKPGHVGEPQLVALGQRMAGRQDEHAWLLRDGLKADPGCADRGPDESDVGGVVEQARRRLGEIEGPQADLDLRVRLLERRQESGRCLTGRGDVQADVQLAANHVSGVAGRGDAAIEGG